VAKGGFDDIERTGDFILHTISWKSETVRKGENHRGGGGFPGGLGERGARGNAPRGGGGGGGFHLFGGGKTIRENRRREEIDRKTKVDGNDITRLGY